MNKSLSQLRCMKPLALLFILFQSCINPKNLHHNSILVDTHNDILTTVATDGLNLDHDLRGRTHSDMSRFKDGGVDVQFFSIWCDGKMQEPFSWANREIDSLYSIVGRNSQRIEMAFNLADLRRIIRSGRLAAMIGIEGGHMIENDLRKLDSLFRRGARYLTLTWNNSVSWASSAYDETLRPDSIGQLGLNEFGRSVVKRMNELGMMIDVSHVGEKTFWDMMEVTTKPVIASHSCVHDICPVFRNLKDDQIKSIAANGGVICLNFYSGFVDSAFIRKSNEFKMKHKQERDSVLKTVSDPHFADVYIFSKYSAEAEALRPTIAQLIDHVDYIVNLVGVDHVGMGSDFDGVSSLPSGIDGVEDFPKITEELLRRGYSKREIRKILGENVLRVIGAQEK